MDNNFVASPEILAALRSTMHVRRKGNLGWERLDSFLERVQMTVFEARTWSRQRIADHVRAVEKFAAELNQKKENQQ
jgi:hypothetical protein